MEGGRGEVPHCGGEAGAEALGAGIEAPRPQQAFPHSPLDKGPEKALC